MLQKPLTSAEMTEIYRQNVALVRSCAMGILPLPEFLEDIVQDVFVSFVRLANKKDIENVPARLYMLATRAALRMRNEWKRSKRIDVLDAKMPFLDTRLKSADQRLTFMKIIDTVREEEATVAVAYFMEQMTQVEIADSMGLSQRHVSRIIERFLQHAHRRANDMPPEKEIASRGLQNG